MVLSPIIFFLIVSSPGLLEQINSSYVDSVYELPDSSGNPQIIWQQKNHIRAWIDIVGFRHMAYINGAYYVPGAPDAIIQSGAELYVSKGQQCATCELDFIKNTITVAREGNYTIATMQVTLRFHETLCSQNSCWLEYHEEKGTFQDSELSPLIYNPDLEHAEINEVNYNHSLYAEKLIYINTSNLITRYNVSDTLHRLQIGEVQYTRKNIPYANFSAFDTWKGNHINNAAVVPINASYTVKAYSPFGRVNNTNLTVTNKLWTPEKAIAHFTFLIIFILGVAFIGINKMRKL